MSETDRMPTLMGRYKVPHFDAKGEADALFLATGLPLTRCYPSFYWESFISSGAGPKPGPDGTLVLSLPMADRPLPGVAAEDIGAAVYGILRAGSDFHGKQAGIAGGQLTGVEMAAALTRALGRIVRYQAIAPVYPAASASAAPDSASRGLWAALRWGRGPLGFTHLRLMSR
jgi:uncharacterized protein YbjT (DUF2867 family)